METVKKQEAQADKAYEIQTNVMQQQVVAEAVRVQQIEREQQIKVQEAEILRREKELIATVLKQAEVERQRISVLAEAEKSRLSIEAEGAASAMRMRGEAEADIIFKKGDAEARAMNVKAEAFQEYNQAAVIDKLLTSMPEIVRGAGLAAREGRQDHDRLDREQRLDRDAQDDQRHDGNRRAGAGPLRGALGRADGGPALARAQDWRQQAGGGVTWQCSNASRRSSARTSTT